MPAETSLSPEAFNAQIAQHVGSTRLADPWWNPQPPSAFWDFRKNGKQKSDTNSESLE
jgi:hypothetical protein